jgi:hypothetical protein
MRRSSAWQEDIMRTKPIWRAAVIAASATAALGSAADAFAATGQPGGEGHSGGVRHVLLISVDGLHQQDLTWYVKNYPHSLLATLDHRAWSTATPRRHSPPTLPRAWWPR